MTAAVVCVGVFAGSLLLAWRLGRFLKDCDRGQADPYTVVDMRRSTAVIEEAERIVRNAYSVDPTTWP